MARVYNTKDGDVLDDICFRQYGTSDAVITVLEANPNLADQGAILTAGIAIILPDYTPEAIEDTDTLWS